MDKLAGGQWRAEGTQSDHPRTGTETIVPDATARTVARARRLMIISGLTTLVVIAAVLGAIGYRVFRASGSGGAAKIEATVTLPKSTRVVGTAVSTDRIAVTLDIAGATEIRIFDAKTLKETRRMRFTTEP